MGLSSPDYLVVSSLFNIYYFLKLLFLYLNMQIKHCIVGP